MMPSKRLAIEFTLAVGLCATFAGGLAQAAESEDDALDTAALERSWQWIRAPRDVVSRSVTGLGRSMDNWLKGEGIGEQQNESFLRVRLYQKASSINGYNSRVKVGGSVDLPGASERFKLILESDVDEMASMDDSVLGDSDDGVDIGGFRYERPRSRNLSITHDIGVRAKLPIDPFYRFTAKYVKGLSSRWSVGFKQKIWYYDGDGAGYDSRLFFSNNLENGGLLQFTSRINYKEKRGTPEVAQIVALHQSLGDQETITYEVGVLGRSRNAGEITDHYAQIRHRKAIYEDWLILELTPQVIASADNRWKTEFRIVVNLDVLFFDF